MMVNQDKELPYDEFSGAELLSEDQPALIFHRRECKAWHPEFGLIYEVVEDGERKLASIVTFSPDHVRVRRPRLSGLLKRIGDCSRKSKEQVLDEGQSMYLVRYPLFHA